MHMNPVYNDVVRDVSTELSDSVRKLTRLGVNDILIDPGFGFGKTLSHNYQLLQQAGFFQSLSAAGGCRFEQKIHGLESTGNPSRRSAQRYYGIEYHGCYGRSRCSSGPRCETCSRGTPFVSSN